ncbi:hypothetical protein WJX81_007969 [Elliptochloris bilobata]|uniref:Uncharacterized protein n=1 Tax=Elliptochloris bilobata TaxID=381761 RepID=A0AAW1QHC7_9CHLO
MNGDLGAYSREQCSTVLKTITRHRGAGPFSKAVDPVLLRCPDYFDIVKRPMDLETVGKKLEHKPERGIIRQYRDPAEFREDMRQIWTNCRLYNAVGTPVRGMGEMMSEAWEKKWASVAMEKKWEEEMRRQAIEERDLAGGAEQLPERMESMAREMQALQDQVEQREGAAALPPGDRDMTFEEKRRLSHALGALPGDRLGRVLDIIRESQPVDESGDEVELDIDALATDVLWRLDSYVAEQAAAVRHRTPHAAAAAARAAPADGAAALNTAAAPTGNGPAKAVAASPSPGVNGGGGLNGRGGGSGGGGSAGVSGGGGTSGGGGGGGGVDEVAARTPAETGAPPGPRLANSTSSSGSGSSSDSDSGGEVGSKQIGADGAERRLELRPGATAGSALVSGNQTASLQIVRGKANIPSDTANALQNQNAWEAFKNAAPADAAAGGDGGDNGAAVADGAADDDNLWNEFQSREEQQKKREEEKRVEEERVRAEQARREAEARERAEAAAAAAVAEEAARQAAAAERAAAERRAVEEQRAAEIAKLQNVDKAAADLDEQHHAVDFGAGGAGAASAFGLRVRAGEEEEEDFGDEDEDEDAPPVPGCEEGEEGEV